jgi:hypothetical protein
MRAALPTPVLAHEHAALIAQLAVCSTFAAEDLETFRALLTRFTPGQIADGLEQASAALAAQGHGPDLTAHDDARSYLMLLTGLRRLERLRQLDSVSYPSLLAAA